MKAAVLYSSQCILAEGPLWHAENNCCYWVDIENGCLYEYHWIRKTTRTWKFAERLSMVLQAKDDDLILALNTRIVKFNVAKEQLTWLLDVEPLPSENRCNDGACDSRGRLWVGTMHLQQKKQAGALYCIDSNQQVHKKLGQTTISNGIVWSLDNKRLYYIDSPTQVVQCFIFDTATGGIIFEKNAIEVPIEMGTPDGMTIDEEGMLWIAHWGGFGVYRWNPQNGQLLEKIELPVPQVTSCSFVGENLNYLLITTARENLSSDALEKYPESGDVFIVKPGVCGKLSNKCFF